MPSLSGYDRDLPCKYCGKKNAAARWPANGDLVSFYYQTEPGTYQVTVHCQHCGKDWYIVWDENPGPGCDAAPSPARKEVGSAPGGGAAHVRFPCQSCGKVLRVAGSHTGRQIKCPSCSSRQVVPTGGIAKPARTGRAADKDLIRSVVRQIKRGQQAVISCSERRQVIVNRVKLFQGWAAGGDFPRVTVIAFATADRGVAHPYVILATGPNGELHAFRTTPKFDQLMRDHLPGKSAEDVMCFGYENYSLPGCVLTSTKEFDRIVRDIEGGVYPLSTVIAIDGEPG